MNNRKVINAWAMYDWANSVYSLVISSTIFPVYYNSVTKSAFGSDTVVFFGRHLPNSVLYSYAISFSFLVVCFLTPILSGIADYSGNKKGFMRFFATLGSIACMGLYFFTGKNIEYGILCAVTASIGFAGSLVFYNAYLPEITTPENYDRVSAKGYAMGYIGSVLLMIVNLAMVQKPGWFGIPEGTLPARLSFLMVGVWWIGFSQYTFFHLPRTEARKSEHGLLTKGYRELLKVWHSLKELPVTRRFLAAFFFYSLGVQTVMLLAATFGDKELHLDTGILIGSILIIQLVAIGGAYLFAEISRRMGNVFSLTIMVLLWCVVCIAAYFVQTAAEFVSVAFLVGMIMGGIQSLSRATYSKLLPETEDHASFFSFYDITEKVSIVIGTALFGLMDYLTGSMRNSVWPLLGAFIVGLIVLQSVKSQILKPSADSAS